MDIQFARSCTPSVVIHNQALIEFIAGEDRCLKFVNQDLTFLQPLVILPISGNTFENDNSPAPTGKFDSQVTSPAAANLLNHVINPQIQLHQHRQLN